VPTRTRKTVWDRFAVWGMLRNPAYAGRACFADNKPLRANHLGAVVGTHISKLRTDPALSLAEIDRHLAQLHDTADTATVEQRQRVLRLLVKEILVGPEQIVIRPSIPTRGDTTRADTEALHACVATAAEEGALAGDPDPSGHLRKRAISPPAEQLVHALILQQSALVYPPHGTRTAGPTPRHSSSTIRTQGSGNCQLLWMKIFRRRSWWSSRRGAHRVVRRACRPQRGIRHEPGRRGGVRSRRANGPGRELEEPAGTTPSPPPDTVESVPEGDTVYLAGKRLRAALAGHRLLRGELRHPRLVHHDLTGRAVLGVASVGKHLFTRFDDGTSLHSHFRMDGAWHLYRPGMAWQRPTHEVRAVLETSDRMAVGFALHDLELLPTTAEARLVGHLGPDLLDPAWDDGHAAEAQRRFTARGASELGLVLLEQRVLAGVGNLYKTEVCFLLGLSPWTLVRDVPDPEAAIALSRKLLLRNADRPEQSTTGELGRGRQHWVFERGGQRCRRCGTRIRTAEQGDGGYARVAYWCPRCQPGPAPQPSRLR